MNRTQSIGSVWLFSCLLVFMALTGATHVSAQGQNGILTGTVTDLGGVVPGATVVATDPATGLLRSAVSNDQGIFRILPLPAGRYGVRVEMASFRQTTLTGRK